MSEQTINVSEIDARKISDSKEQKVVLAMQATAALDTTGFNEANTALLIHCSETEQAPTLTYEDLIFANPLGAAAYVMSQDAEVASHEALFYRAHRHIEEELAGVISALGNGEYNESVNRLKSSTRQFGGLYRSLSSDAFARFRPYFTGINGYPGPSGLFTAAIPIIDLLGHGGMNIDDQEHQRLIDYIDRGLYPSHQAGILKYLLENRERVQVPPDEVAQEIGQQLNRFRNVHGRSVQKFVPEAMNAGAEGSGGVANVGEYLASKVINMEGDRND